MTKSIIEEQIFNFKTLYSNEVFLVSLKSSKENIDSHLRISFQFFFFFFRKRFSCYFSSFRYRILYKRNLGA